jgi:hypothetical protein
MNICNIFNHEKLLLPGGFIPNQPENISGPGISEAPSSQIVTPVMIASDSSMLNQNVGL